MRLAGEHDLLCLPGSMFGPGQERYLRIAFANAEASDMETLVDRLVDRPGGRLNHAQISASPRVRRAGQPRRSCPRAPARRRAGGR